MVRLRVILAEPKYQGNVGAVARLCRNFEIEELALVNPPSLGEEAKERSMHAWEFLQQARVTESWREAVADLDFLVGTTAKVPPSDKRFLRNPVDARELPGKLEGREGLVGLAFGREDFGLLTGELEDCDLMVTIPTSHEYRSLNLSHAVAVVLYEFFEAGRTGPFKSTRVMDGRMRDALYQMLDLYIEAIGLPEHKKVVSRRVVRKLLGRAVPSSWEFYVVMGLLKRGLRNMGRSPAGLDDGAGDLDVPDEIQEDLERLFLD
jgi:TrmH family RNA methyltransferase